ncbi:MAG: TerB family tellurite resistance protein [Pseudomonadota bacterium]
MLKDILDFFTPEPPKSDLSTDDARLALAALMVRIARSDGDYAAVEKAVIRSALIDRYALAGTELDTLIADAEELESKAPDTVRFTRVLKDHVPYEDRKALLSSLWSVVLADGERDSKENALLRMLAQLLGVTDKDSALARQSAERSA